MIKINKSSLWIVILLFAASCSNIDNQLKSFDKNLTVEFILSEGHRPTYMVLHEENVVLDTSSLGVVLDDMDLSENMSLASISGPEVIEDAYSLLHGKQKEISYTAHEKTFHLEHTSGQKMDIIFRVSDESVAFRYHFPGISNQVHKISEEKTSFHYPNQTRAWLQPLANVNTGFAETNPSYEEHYYIDVEVGTPAPDSAGWAYPALFKTDNTWTLISETGLKGNYAATRLRENSEGGNYQIGFPQAGEEFPGRALYPQSDLPWTTPWRIIAIGDLGTIVESTLGTDLADPAEDMDTSWIKPGSASWSWAKLKDDATNFEDQKRFIDYAAEMGWEYTLVDANWDQTIGYERIQKLVDYAAEKNVDILLWYNSSGSWNQTVMSPKSALLTHEDRVEEFSKIHEMGVKGVKVDFFAGDGQSMIQYYLDIFRDAADHELLVNTHGATLPRGWHRTWPNLMTMESVKGFEFITFEQPNADLAAVHSTMLPFTRNVFSPMDFTPMSLTSIPNIERKTTSAFELASPILFTSGIQHYAETARGMEEVPQYIQDFIKKIPVSWDKTKFVDGFPGKYVVVARQEGNRWFVAGINGENKERTLSLDLSFLPNNIDGEIISDGEDQFLFNHEIITLNDSKTLEVTMKGSGGFAILFDENVN